MSVNTEDLKKALNVMGISAPESLEELALKQDGYIWRLVHEVNKLGEDGAKSAVQPDVMSPDYRAMTYFVVATLYFYRGSIKNGPYKNITDFRDENSEVLERVFKEGLNIFNYELSYNQMDSAILAYLQEPQEVENTKVYELDKAT